MFTLALGIGATTAIFSVVDAVLLAPLPYDQPERLVRLWSQWEGSPQSDLSPAEYFDYRERLDGFEAIGAYAIQSMNLTGGDAPEQLQGGYVSASVFRVFGAEPALGRVFTAEEDRPGAAAVVVLSDGLWRRRFGAEPEIVGRSIMIDGQPTTVIGVMPPTFRLPEDLASGESTDLFVPLGIDRTTIPNRGSHFLIGVGRLAPAITIATARSEIAAVAAEFVRDFPDEYPPEERFTATVDPLRDAVLGPVRPALLALLGAVSLVLLIACANVAGLLLARTAARRREFAVRSALGAGRARVASQLVVESLLLALAGGAAGLLVALLATDALATLQPGDLPRVAEVGIDLRVLGFALGVSVMTGLAFGLLPALRTTPDLQSALKDGDRSTTGGGRRHSRGLLVGGEIALALVLLLGAGLLLRSFARLQQVDPGFRTENILTLSVSLPEESYPAENEVVSFFEQLLTRVEGLPAVRSAGAVAWLPLATTRGDLNFTIEGRPIPEGAASPSADWQVLTPGYLSAIGMQILRGRPLRAEDDVTAPGAVVINETMADLYWPGEDPLGQRFLLGGGAGPGWVTVVGITRDVRYLDLETPPQPEMYLPHAQFRLWDSGEAMDQMTLAVRTAGDPMALVDAIRSEVRALDPTLPVAEVQTMEQVASASVAQRRFTMLLLMGFAGVALALAAVGIYGVMVNTVAQRVREIGIRMALGASPGDVAGMVVRQGMLLALAGIAAGCVIALGVTRALSSLLYEVSPTDPATIAGAMFVLAAVALLAAWLPARRATRVDPLIALRSE